CTVLASYKVNTTALLSSTRAAGGCKHHCLHLVATAVVRAPPSAYIAVYNQVTVRMIGHRRHSYRRHQGTATFDQRDCRSVERDQKR
ncbi:MAG: hypothetical protein ABI882_18360, partial [Acidobacteriota bacterium]